MVERLLTICTDLSSTLANIIIIVLWLNDETDEDDEMHQIELGVQVEVVVIQDDVEVVEVVEQMVDTFLLRI